MDVAIITTPGHGHINPLLPIAAELTQGGDRVRFVAPNGFAPVIAASGAELVSLGDLALPQGLVAPDGPAVREAMGAFFQQAGTAMAAAVAAISASPPDVLVYDAMLPMMGVGSVREIAVPRVAFFPSFAIREGVRLSDLIPRDPEADVVAALPHADEPAPAEPLNLVVIPRSYQPNGEDFDERYLFVGPSLREEPATEFSIPSPDGRPLLYVSLGTVASDSPEVYQAVLAAVAERSWRVVIATGRTPPASLGPVSGNVIVRPHVPQLAVLREADLFLTHGGMNSVMESIALGVPMVVVPQAADQFASAQRVGELGLGQAVASTPTTEALLAAADAVLADPGYRQRTRAMAADMGSGGAPRAVAAIRVMGRSRR
jgi:UDP:flavonoid glycosyltransferase YjiC (YdhE family)